MGYNDLFSKVEEALKVVVDAAGLDSGVTVNTGLDDDNIQAPYVLCGAVGSSGEVVTDTATHEIQAQVIVASSADDGDTPLATHRAFVQTVFDAILDSDIAATLTAAVSDFTVLDVWESSRDSDQVERDIRNILNLTLIAAPSDIT